MIKRFITTISLLVCLLGITMFNVCAEDIPTQYRGVIEKYVQAINEQWDKSKLDANGLFSGWSYQVPEAGQPASLTTIGYTLKDVDNNGTQDWVSNNETAGNPNGNKIEAIQVRLLEK